MKTIYEHLNPGCVYDHKTADEMCMGFQKTAKLKTEFEKNTRVALYRFATLTFSFLSSEVNPDEFTYESFVKLLKCEVKCENYKSNYQTVFDVLIENASKKNSTIYLMNEYYQSFLEHMPDNADDIFDFYMLAFKDYAINHDIEINVEELQETWEQVDERYEKEADKDERNVNDDGMSIKEIAYTLHLIISFRDRGEYDFYKEACGKLTLMEPGDDSGKQDLKTRLEELLDDYMEHGEVLRLLDDHYEKVTD